MIFLWLKQVPKVYQNQSLQHRNNHKKDDKQKTTDADIEQKGFISGYEKAKEELQKEILESELIKEFQLQIKEKDIEIEKYKELSKKHQSEKDSLFSKNEELTAKIEKLIPGFNFDANSETATWEDALAKCNGDYVKARNKYPELYAKSREEAKETRGNDDE